MNPLRRANNAKLVERPKVDLLISISPINLDCASQWVQLWLDHEPIQPPFNPSLETMDQFSDLVTNKMMPTISRPRRFPFDYRKVLFAVLFSSSRPSQGIQNRYRCLYECSGELFMAYKNPINAFVRTMSRDLCVFSRSSEDVVGSGKVSLKTWEVNVEILLFSTPHV